MARTKKAPTIVEEVKEPITQTILEVEEEVKPITKVVNTYRLNVRKAPRFNAEIVREVAEGTKVTPLTTEGEWTKIGIDEWVVTKYLK